MWTGPTYQVYYLRLEDLVREELAKKDSAYLLQVDFEEYLQYLVSEFSWQPLEWYEDGISVEPFSVNEGRGDHVDRRPIIKEKQWLRLRIPISRHPRRADYFNFGPSTTRGAEPDWKFENDVLVHEVEATEQAVERGKDDIRFWLGNRNKDIESGNKSLPDRVRRVWESKRKQLEQQHGTMQALIQKLNIPLHQDPKARAKPIEIRPRQLRTVVEKPKAAPRAEPILQREDLLKLVDFIEVYTRQFEVTPKTYAKLDEEELRDLLIGMMNANYPGSTTGETFSKLGKTDIFLRVDSGNVLICECKFWSGAKDYGEAIGQLFDYLTWRQNYGVLIHFCKLRNMSTAVSEAKRAATEYPSFTPGTTHEHSDTRFTSRHVHPQDSGKSVEVHHLFLDLSV